MFLQAFFRRKYRRNEHLIVYHVFLSQTRDQTVSFCLGVDIAYCACYTLSIDRKGGAGMTKQETYAAHGVASEVLPLLRHTAGLIEQCS
jgi:hypothetical protein